MECIPSLCFHIERTIRRRNWNNWFSVSRSATMNRMRSENVFGKKMHAKWMGIVAARQCPLTFFEIPIMSQIFKIHIRRERESIKLNDIDECVDNDNNNHIAIVSGWEVETKAKLERTIGSGNSLALVQTRDTESPRILELWNWSVNDWLRLRCYNNMQFQR